MSREKKFRELIEKSESEEKSRIWNKIEESSAAGMCVTTYERRRKRRLYIRVASICMAAAVFVGIGVAGGIVWGRMNFSRKKEGDDDTRYCATDGLPAYIDKTLKVFAEETGRQMLYWDWYGKGMQPCGDMIYNDEETGEFLAFREVIDICTDELYCAAEVNVMDCRLEMEVFSLYHTICTRQYYSEKGGTEIYWGINSDRSCAYFQYGDYVYYVKLDMCWSFVEEKELTEEETALIWLAEALFDVAAEF